MGAILDGLREELDSEASYNLFGRKRHNVPKDGGMLYLSARMHDAEDKAKEMEKLAYATEKAAMDIIKRYDGDGSLYRQFKEQIELHKRHMR